MFSDRASYRSAYCLNNPLKYSDPSGMLANPASGNPNFDLTDFNNSLDALGQYFGSMTDVTAFSSLSFGGGGNYGNYYYDAKNKVWRDGDGNEVDGQTYVNEIAPQLAGTIGGLDIQKAVNWLNNNAYSNYDKVPVMNGSSIFRCATWVVTSLRAGGLEYKIPTLHAKDFGPSLKAMGFQEVIVNDGKYITGDIVIIQPPPGRTSGHMMMWSGNQWISDWKQGNRFWPGQSYIDATPSPSYTVYRYIKKP
jgi:hypothetical protein